MCGFRYYFTSLIGGLLNFQSPYCFAIGHQGVFSLGGWTLLFHTEFHELDTTLVHLGHIFKMLQDYHRLWSSFPTHSHSKSILTLVSATPARRPVWAIPISLAATDGIEVSFFSYRYLDVSVPCVRFHTLYIQVRMIPKDRVSPFRNLKITACLPAPLSLSQATTSFIAS